MTSRDDRRRFAWGLASVVSVCASGLTNEALAMWVRLSDEQLVEQSELIMTGTLIGVSRLQSGSLDLTIGVIKVDEVFKGPSSTVAFVAVPRPEGPLSSTDIRYNADQRGLWYLRRRIASEQGIYLADHPQRFVPTEHAQKAIAELRKLRPR